MIAKELRRLGRIAAGAALLLAAGCDPDAGRTDMMPPPAIAGERTGDVTMYRDIQFEDIPTPPEYMLIEHESHSFQGSLFRTGSFVYEGPVEWRQAMDFFRDRMQAGGWTLEHTELGPDFRLFRFRKGPEAVIIVVRQMRYGSRAEIQLDNVERNDLLLRGKLQNDAKR